MKKILGVIVLLVVVVGAMLVPKYNRLVTLDNEVDSAYSEVDVVIKRRADLIPNLVQTVKGYAKHEEETFTKVIEARNKVSNASTPEELSNANSELTTAIRNLNVVVENYPELKANTNFLDLQTQLEGTENRIATARTRYNEKVKDYNQVVRQFPMNLFAGIFGFDKKDYFQASESDQNTPSVNF